MTTRPADSISGALERTVERPLRVGDRVRVYGSAGQVRKIDSGDGIIQPMYYVAHETGTAWYGGTELERIDTPPTEAPKPEPEPLPPTDIRHADDTIASWLRGGEARCIREVAGIGKGTVLVALDCSNLFATGVEATVATGEGATYPRARRDLARRLYEMRARRTP